MDNESARLISVNVGLARTVVWRGQTITTGIFKVSVDHAVPIGREALEGDQQADRTVHGGVDKAVYAYSAEDYGGKAG